MILLLAALATTQILGWGTTFYIPATLGEAAMAATGFPRPLVFGGITVMYVVGGLAAPPVGRLVDRSGARGVMLAGSALGAAALGAMPLATHPAGWVACWMAIGLMMPMALANSAYAAVAQAAIARGIPPRRPMGALALATGLAISVAFPAGTWAERHLGWHGTLWAFAAVNLLVCLPLHALVPRHGGAARSPPAAAAASRVAPERAARVMLLLAAAFTLSGFCQVSLELHLLALLGAAGVSPGLAVSLAALSGPLRVAARLADMVLARRFSALTMGLFAMALLPPGLLCLLAGGVPGAIGFILLWSVSMGISTVARAALPLELFGAAGYATRLGRLTLPINLGQALGPLVFAGLLDAAGARAVALMALCVAAAAFGALALVARAVR